MADGRLTTEDLARPAPPAARDEDEQRIDLDAGTSTSPTAGRTPPGEEDLPLLEEADLDRFLDRWSEVQARFVDDPKGAVRDGDALVAELMQALAQRFSARKGALEEQWNRGGEPETEELRRALQSYRSFFQRLLAT